MDQWLNKVICGDILQGLPLPDGCVQTCVTSPPYWGLRDYGVAGQIGLESTPEEFVEHIVAVFREVRRVLRNDGTCWLNLGDSYYTNGTGTASLSGNKPMKATNAGGYTGYKPRHAMTNMKPKDLVGIPWMVAFALRADGWYLRSDIIWAKPNPMPESVTDRPTKAHEYLFLLAKNEHYYYDAEAIREPHVDPERGAHAPSNDFGGHRVPGKEDEKYVTGWRKKEEAYNPAGRNRRTVWNIATHPFPEAHFATFPPALVEPCILAGSSPQACPVCGAPWKRMTEKTFTPQQDVRDPDKLNKSSNKGMDASNNWGDTPRGTNAVVTTGWQPTCSCPNNDGSGRSIVLDPFMGSGTTALVAYHHSRNFVGWELNPDYVKMARKRIEIETRQMRMFV